MLTNTAPVQRPKNLDSVDVVLGDAIFVCQECRRGGRASEKGGEVNG